MPLSKNETDELVGCCVVALAGGAGAALIAGGLGAGGMVIMGTVLLVMAMFLAFMMTR